MTKPGNSMLNTLMKQFMTQLCLSLGLLFVLVSSAQAVINIQASVDRNPVSINESFQIIFTANDSPDDDPDFSVLNKDFEVLNQSHSSKSSWINGQSSKIIEWTLTVMARHTGSLIIPPVRFGDDVSQAATVLVTQADQQRAIEADKDIFLEVEVTPQTPYVQSQILYTLRLYRRVQISQASLTEPNLDDAVVEKLGEDANYTTQVNSVNYAVTERKYAIFPQKSGVVTIAPMQLTAEVVINTRPSFNGFFNRQATRTKRVMSKAVTLEVKPIPDSFTGSHWLSADELYLKQEWSGDINNMKVGEPLTRTLTLLAKSTTVGQLPELHSEPKDSQLKTYPDQPVLTEDKSENGLLALREEKIAFIPSKAGSYQLPAIEIPWFNNKTQKMELARIEPTTISAVAAGAPTQAMTKQAMPIKEQQTATSETKTVVRDNPIWMWLSAFLATGWLLTIIFFLRQNKSKAKFETGKSQKPKAVDFNKLLKQACADNNAQQAKAFMIDWGQKQLNESSLGAIAMLCDQDLRTELLYLNQCLYSPQATAWDGGQRLYQAFLANKLVSNQHEEVDDSLEPLFKV